MLAPTTAPASSTSGVSPRARTCAAAASPTGPAPMIAIGSLLPRAAATRAGSVLSLAPVVDSPQHSSPQHPVLVRTAATVVVASQHSPSQPQALPPCWCALVVSDMISTPYPSGLPERIENYQYVTEKRERPYPIAATMARTQAAASGCRE